jgi:hypothetical protein
MREWGWTSPVLADEEGGLIAGHARLLAARQLGIAEIPVMVARGWTEAQKREVSGLGVAHDLTRVADRLQIAGDDFVERCSFQAGDLDDAASRRRERHIGDVSPPGAPRTVREPLDLRACGRCANRCPCSRRHAVDD